MADRFTSEQRSAVMRKVPTTGSAAELAVRRALTALGVRYRLNRRDLPGSPDIVMSGRRLVIFVHGCFWHGHDCRRGDRPPRANAEYWRAKIERNRVRDETVHRALSAARWRVETIWECELKPPDRLQARLRCLLDDQAAATDAISLSGLS